MLTVLKRFFTRSVRRLVLALCAGTLTFGMIQEQAFFGLKIVVAVYLVVTGVTSLYGLYRKVV